MITSGYISSPWLVFCNKHNNPIPGFVKSGYSWDDGKHHDRPPGPRNEAPATTKLVPGNDGHGRWDRQGESRRDWAMASRLLC